MSSPTTAQISYRTLPGSGSEALRSINQIWGISDVVNVIPSHLHPQNRHCSNEWNPRFQAELSLVSRVVYRHELEEFKTKCQDTVEIRCGVKARNAKKAGKRVRYLTVEDLESVKRVFGHKRAMERLHELERVRIREEESRRIEVEEPLLVQQGLEVTEEVKVEEEVEMKEEPDVEAGGTSWSRPRTMLCSR